MCILAHYGKPQIKSCCITDIIVGIQKIKIFSYTNTRNCEAVSKNEKKGLTKK